jgi:hypothetical protein
MNNLMFNGEGPLMSGTWYNPTNGDSFTVMDSFFQDNQYIVKTTDGRMLDYNFIQNYVKSDTPIQKPQQSAVQKPSQLPHEVASILDNGYDMIPEDTMLGNLNNRGTSYSQVSQNESIISKALSKRELPKTSTKLSWTNFPEKEIMMLVDLMEVNIDEIIDWYVSKVDLNSIKESLHKDIKQFIDNSLRSDETPALVESPVLEETPKKISKKTKPKK